MVSVMAVNNVEAFTYNPRGDLWFNDESTFGRKLLMKMGWNKGKGLGKNEDGIKENLKSRFRNTNSGLGFKDDAYTNVMKTEYESILKNLNTVYAASKPPSIDEDTNKQQKSRVVKSRLRYPKLFFGKDVTKYTEKDMKSIFICGQLVKDNEKEDAKDPVSTNDKDSDSGSSESVCTYSSNLSISDYFAKKMQERKNKMLNKNSYNDPCQQETSFEFETIKTEALAINRKASKRKRKELEMDINNEFTNDLHFHQDISVKVENLTSFESEAIKTETLAINRKESKRKRKELEMDINKESTDDLHFHQDTSVKVENLASFSKKKSSKKLRTSEVSTNEGRIESLQTENETKSKNSKKIKQKLLENSACDSNISNNGELKNHNSCKPNKKRKKSQTCENDTTKMVSENESAESCSASIKKRNKVKYSPGVDLLLENSVSEKDTELVESSKAVNDQRSSESTEFDLLVNNTDCTKKKKKHKKKLKQKLKSCLKSKSASYSMKNVSFNETVSYRFIDSDFEAVGNLSECQGLNEDESFFKVNIGDESCTSDKTPSVQEVKTDEQNADTTTHVPEKILDEIDEGCSLSSIPSSKSSHYNLWIESQRQALKMKLYKDMLKSIKKHKIFKTTNMLSIKGYGNWGF